MDLLNSAQTKLLANFCSDLAKGLLLAAVSAPFVSKEVWFLRLLLSLVSCLIALMLLRTGVGFLEGAEK